MKQRILKLVSQIKDNLKEVDNDGVYHPLLDDVYDSLELIETEIYDDDDLALDPFASMDEDY
jgi:hypothetical protein